jgi:hypothetical protein
MENIHKNSDWKNNGIRTYMKRNNKMKQDTNTSNGRAEQDKNNESRGGGGKNGNKKVGE